MPVRFTRTRRGRRAALPPALAAQLGIKVKKPRATEEHDDQVQLFEEHIEPRLVDGAVGFAIPNGGHRAKRVAAAMKKEGVKRGVPDIFLMYATTAYFIEMKKLKGGRTSPEQKLMIAKLTRAGAICAVCKGLAEAVTQLEAWGLLEPAENCAIADSPPYLVTEGRAA